MNEDTAYILGVLHGDASIWTEHHTKEYPNAKSTYISLTCKSLRFAKSFQQSLERLAKKNVKIKKVKLRIKAGEGRFNYEHIFEGYRVRLGSNKLCSHLLDLKSKTERIVKNMSVRQKIAFLRGLFDSEGDKRVIERKYLFLRMTNTSHRIMAIAKTMLEDLGYRPTLCFPPSQVRGELNLYKQKDTLRFMVEIKNDW